FVYRQAPTVMSGKKITIIHQKSDIVRLQLLYMNGGIYLDVDQVVLRSLDSLL
ncbi:glycosyltransferase family 32 protein, partial [Biomphalaria glabrata]